MLSRIVPLLLLSGACRREAPAAPAVDAPAVDAPAVDAPAVDAPAPCGPVFSGDDSVRLPDGELDEFDVSCSAASMALQWRVGASIAWATRPLRDESRWATGTYDLAPGALGGSLLSQGARSWSVRAYRDDSLSLREVGASEVARVPLAALRPRELSTPQLLWVEGGRALVALHGRVSGGEREVWLLAFGAGPVSYAAMARGSIGATAAGAEALVTAVVTNPDRSVALRGRWLDARRALRSLGGGRVAELDGWLSDASIRLPHRGIAFSPGVNPEGAMLLQAVIGAERGGAYLGRFGRDGAVEDVFMGVIPSGLGDVVSAGGAHTAYWWDERYRPVARVYRGARSEPQGDLGEAVGGAFAALRAARMTRRIRCGAGVWSVRAEGARALARRVDCAR